MFPILFLFFWLIGCLIVALIGSNRTIGFFLAGLAAFFFSPLVGLAVVALYKSNKQLAWERKVEETLIARAKQAQPPPPTPDTDNK